MPSRDLMFALIYSLLPYALKATQIYLSSCVINASVKCSAAVLQDGAISQSIVCLSALANADKHTIDYEIAPSYNTAAEHLTEAFITHDDKYIYVAFKAYGNKEYIRANIRSRDGIAWQNDHVVVGIDTFGDGRYYIGFGVNPLGSIYDFKTTATNNDPDRSYNIEFDASNSML